MQNNSKSYRIRGLIVLILITFMVGLSELMGESEIIFPEIAALAIGALFAPVQPWKVSKPKLVILIAIHSMIGVSIVKFLPINIIFKVLIGVAVSLISLIISKSTFAPLLSATVLPIIMNTTSLIYPISATLFALIIVLIQAVFEATKLQPKNINLKKNYKLKDELITDLQRFVVIAVMSVPVLLFDFRFAIAPPLIVAFVELTSPKNKLIKTPLKAWVVMSVLALTGSMSRVIFSEWFSLPLWVSTMVATLILLIAVKGFKVYFPPIGAITILPMIVSADALIVYPLEVAFGFGLFVDIAYFMQNHTLHRKKVKQ